MQFQKKRCVAMLLAGGQGSRLMVLTENTAKPAVPFGGKYRIIDFPLSNCVNSKIDTVGILTQYQPLILNDYIGNGQPWDLDRAFGAVHILSPYQNPADNLHVCRIPFIQMVLLFQIAVQHGRCFRAGCKACRIDPAAACAAHDSCFICPGKRLTRIAAYAACVREAFKRCGHSGTLAAIAAVAVQNCCELLSCNRVIRRKPSAAAAVDDVVFRCPCNSICIVHACWDIMESGCFFCCRASL